jgi:hypothetical protein
VGPSVRQRRFSLPGLSKPRGFPFYTSKRRPVPPTAAGAQSREPTPWRVPLPSSLHDRQGVRRVVPRAAPRPTAERAHHHVLAHDRDAVDVAHGPGRPGPRAYTGHRGPRAYTRTPWTSRVHRTPWTSRVHPDAVDCDR